jgi:hypothetical protein
MAEDLEGVAPRENAHVKARDRKVRGPKVVAVNPGLKQLAQHISDKRRRKASDPSGPSGRLPRPAAKGR